MEGDDLDGFVPAAVAPAHVVHGAEATDGRSSGAASGTAYADGTAGSHLGAGRDQEVQQCATKFTAPAVRARKVRDGGEPLVMVTAYDAPGARMADNAGVDLILVGDSVATVVLGYETRSSHGRRHRPPHRRGGPGAKPGAGESPSSSPTCRG